MNVSLHQRESERDLELEQVRTGAVEDVRIRENPCYWELITKQQVCEDTVDRKDLECAVVICRL
jgi:hypothetical protein